MFLVAKKCSIAIVALVAIMANTAVEATNHTLCFDYFMGKDQCVFATNDPNRRCDPDGHPPKKGVSMVCCFCSLMCCSCSLMCCSFPDLDVSRFMTDETGWSGAAAS